MRLKRYNESIGGDKVYILTYSRPWDDDTTIVGVFSTKDSARKAERLIQIKDKKYGYNIYPTRTDIEEYTLDQSHMIDMSKELIEPDPTIDPYGEEEWND